jgi:hypothetical protein
LVEQESNETIEIENNWRTLVVSLISKSEFPKLFFNTFKPMIYDIQNTLLIFTTWYPFVVIIKKNLTTILKLSDSSSLWPYILLFVSRPFFLDGIEIKEKTEKRVISNSLTLKTVDRPEETIYFTLLLLWSCKKETKRFIGNLHFFKTLAYYFTYYYLLTDMLSPR